MSNTTSEVRRGALSPGSATSALWAALALAGCTHLPAPAHPRPALPLPDEIAQRFVLPGTVTEELLVPIGEEDGVRFFRGRLRSGDELAEFHLLLPPARDGHAEPPPMVLCLPILAGGRALMWMLATSLTERGYAVAWAERVASALKPGQRGQDLEQLFRNTVLHNRMVLAWARTQPTIDAERIGCVGISMGGMVGAALLAVEPDLCGGALCLAGGDLPGMVLVSTEGRVLSWLRWRQQIDGASGEILQAELRRELVSDPARMGSYIPTDKVLLVSGLFDSVVPTVHQELLWESLGRPERRTMPLGHYTAALAFGSMVQAVDEFLGRRFAERAPAATAAVAR